MDFREGNMKIQSKSALTASLLALIAAQPAAAEDLTIKFSAFVGERNPIFACCPNSSLYLWLCLQLQRITA